MEQLLQPGAPTAVQLAAEVNVPHQTLSRWLVEARSVEDMSRKKKRPTGRAETERAPRSTREWPAAEKLRVVVAASQLSGEALGAFLRQEGLYESQLDAWRADVLAALDEPGRSRPLRPDPSVATVRELQRELSRKEKALAEVTALLVLRKKLEALFGDGGEGSSTDETNEKK